MPAFIARIHVLGAVWERSRTGFTVNAEAVLDRTPAILRARRGCQGSARTARRRRRPWQPRPAPAEDAGV